MFFIACGRIIVIMVCADESPNDLPASSCPGSMEDIPLRIISAVYAPEFMPKVSIATQSPSFTEAKIMKNIIMSCTVTGVPRITAR